MRIIDFHEVALPVATALSTAWNEHYGCRVLPDISGGQERKFKQVRVSACWADGEVEASVNISSTDWLTILDGEFDSFDGEDYSACDGMHESNWSFDGSGRGHFSGEYEDGGTPLYKEPFSSFWVEFVY